MDLGHAPRFLTDTNFSRHITTGLRRRLPNLDLIEAQELGVRDATDPNLLAVAKDLDRILLTHDARTMPLHFATFQMRLAEGAYSPGVLIVRQTLAVGIAIQQLLEIATASGHTEWRGGCVFLPL